MKPKLISLFFIWPLLHCLNAQEYPIHVTEQGYILVEVQLNEQTKANFILDTGAGLTVLSTKTFNQIKEVAKPEGYFTGFRHDADRIDGEIYKLPSLSIGDIKAKNIIIGVYPPLDDYGIDGLISLKFFENHPFTIDYVRQKLILLKEQELESLTKNMTVFPLSIHQHKDITLDIFISICLNDKVSLDAEFDTGSGHHTLLINPYFLKALQLDPNQLEESTYTTPISGKNLKDLTSNINKVSLCGDNNLVTQNKLAATFREGLIYEALIGSGLFKDRAISIDIPGKRFIVHQ